MQNFVVAIPYVSDTTGSILVHLDMIEADSVRNAVVLVLKQTPGLRMHGVATVRECNAGATLWGENEPVVPVAVEGWTR